MNAADRAIRWSTALAVVGVAAIAAVAWFTDDAGFRWQLDEYMHLAQAAKDDEYLP